MNLSDPFFWIELGIIIIIVVTQLSVYFRNISTINGLKKIFPAGHKLTLDFLSGKPKESTTDAEKDPAVAEAQKVALIQKDGNYSEEFLEIIDSTNDYILRNKGAAGYAGLENIAERKTKSIEDGIEQIIALPLYLGLLGTFTGVIIGLIKIAISNVSDAAIQSFIGGVLIGMVASAFGLFLTVLSNQAYKTAKKQKDRDLYDYLNFVRLNLVPQSYKSMPTDMKALKYNLAAFTNEFTNYQQSLTSALGDTLSRFEDLQTVFEYIKGLEPGLKSVGQFIRNNNDLVEKQADSIDAVTRKTLSLTHEIGDNLEKMDSRINKLEAYSNGASDAVVTATPVGTATTLDTDELVRVNKSLLAKMESTEASSQLIATNLKNVYDFLQRSSSENEESKGGFLNSFSFKLFTTLGIITFAIGIGIGIWYIINDIFPLYM
ncbi:MotA/TolQ/ExbB proton channel family protein [Flexithrix dorotheae]|uniref:MotA/TolQ/ExbB proton channel family protein n=1 Tax=Flexithrix dorotheae TaxID=70993 RepID=UPI000366C6FC|nr:MotA/TolQ/ExbB proton channel family protein [Flexithrix dorotheae]